VNANHITTKLLSSTVNSQCLKLVHARQQRLPQNATFDLGSGGCSAPHSRNYLLSAAVKRAHRFVPPPIPRQPATTWAASLITTRTNRGSNSIHGPPTGIGVNHSHGSPVGGTDPMALMAYAGARAIMASISIRPRTRRCGPPPYSLSPTPAWVNVNDGACRHLGNGTTPAPAAGGLHQFTCEANQARPPELFPRLRAPQMSATNFELERSVCGNLSAASQIRPPTVPRKVYRRHVVNRRNVYACFQADDPSFQQPQSTRAFCR